MAEISMKQYQDAANFVQQFQGTDPAKMTPDQKAEFSNKLALMAQYQSSIGNAAQDNPSIDPNYILSELSTLQGKELNGAMILNLAVGRPVLWQPEPSSFSGAAPKSLEGWISSATLHFLLAVQDLGILLRDMNVTYAEQSAIVGKAELQLGKDIAKAAFDLKKNESDQFTEQMIASIVFGTVSAALSITSFALSMTSVAKKSLGTDAGKLDAKKFAAGARMMDGMSRSMEQFGQAAQSGIQAGHTLESGRLEQLQKTMEAIMQQMQKARELIDKDRQEALQNLREILDMVKNYSRELHQNASFTPRG